jgi:hypothetical protein
MMEEELGLSLRQSAAHLGVSLTSHSMHERDSAAPRGSGGLAGEAVRLVRS